MLVLDTQPTLLALGLVFHSVSQWYCSTSIYVERLCMSFTRNEISEIRVRRPFAFFGALLGVRADFVCTCPRSNHPNMLACTGGLSGASELENDRI